jgi:hypothetical protein
MERNLARKAGGEAAPKKGHAFKSSAAIRLYGKEMRQLLPMRVRFLVYPAGE